jgi:hypothetical protein
MVNKRIRIYKRREEERKKCILYDIIYYIILYMYIYIYIYILRINYTI